MKNRRKVAWIVEDNYKDTDSLKEFLIKHPEIEFVSLVGVDFMGNDTDERIPVEYFIANLESIMSGGVQTDGSSVNLPGIAELNDAKIDFVLDREQKWFIDYTDEVSPAGTMRIPAFFRHGSDYFCSRSLLKKTMDHCGQAVIKILNKNEGLLKELSGNGDKISGVYFTLGTELEFWVRTPADKVSNEELAVSQMLKESYWKRTKGQVRSALEESIRVLSDYGLEVEMGHKEVGGVKGKVSFDGSLHDVMEQLEIDWKYDTPLKSADNELFARILIKEIFRRKGLEVTFDAKPIDAVAGSGEHMHFGAVCTTEKGRKINIFAPCDENEFLSSLGYGALMGILKNWDILNPYVTNSNDALRRLKPGYEAPISVVSSLGVSPEEPSRNRTVLVGVIKSENPMSVRFELRAPNPHTNTYLAAGSVLIAMVQGMEYASGKTSSDIRKELSKKQGEKSAYLEKEREYVTEKNIFSDFNSEQREALYGKAPETVYEVVKRGRENAADLFAGTPYTDKIRASYETALMKRWVVEIRDKFLPGRMAFAASLVRKNERENSYTQDLWTRIDRMRQDLFKTDKGALSLRKQLEVFLENGDYEAAAPLFLEINHQLDVLSVCYREYVRNTQF